MSLKKKGKRLSGELEARGHLSVSGHSCWDRQEVSSLWGVWIEYSFTDTLTLNSRTEKEWMCLSCHQCCSIAAWDRRRRCRRRRRVETLSGVRSSSPSSMEPSGRVQCATLQLSPGHLSETLTTTYLIPVTGLVEE